MLAERTYLFPGVRLPGVLDRSLHFAYGERLREAGATGAEILLTSCPKCQIHLRCALHDGKLGEELGIEIEDITSFAAKALTG